MNTKNTIYQDGIILTSNSVSIDENNASIQLPNKITPVTKLTDDQVEEVRHAVWKREDLREHIRESLSNEAIAKKLGVNVRTVERVIRYVISKENNG